MDKRQILIVDDELDVLSVLEKALAVEGYSVITASNGIDAVRLANSIQPDLIILDLYMPDVEGEEVAEKLREIHRTMDIPIIFLTALISKSEEKEHGHLIGSNIIFAKPFDAEILLTQIKQLLQKRELGTKSIPDRYVACKKRK